MPGNYRANFPAAEAASLEGALKGLHRVDRGYHRPGEAAVHQPRCLWGGPPARRGRELSLPCCHPSRSEGSAVLISSPGRSRSRSPVIDSSLLAPPEVLACEQVGAGDESFFELGRGAGRELIVH